MKQLTLFFGLHVALLASAAALDPALELRFNEPPAEQLRSTGTEAIHPVLKDKTGNPAALYSTDKGGVSGKPGDHAFDNTAATGMGEAPGGVVEIPDAGGQMIDGAKSFTVTGWYKTGGNRPIDNHTVLLNIGSDDRNFGIILRAREAGTAGLQGRVNGVPVVTSSRGTYPEIGEWVFFAFSCDLTRPGTSNSILYHGSHDGATRIVAKGKADMSEVAANNLRSSIGGLTRGGRPLQGWMDNIRVYISKENSAGALSGEHIEAIRAGDLDNR